MSDGLTDCARSNRIARATDQLLDSQLDFLAEPTKERLEKIYECCSNLKRCPSGYWGESGGGISRRVSQYYQERFGRDIKKTKPEVQDVAILLEKVNNRYQIRFLAELITKRTIKEGKRYWGEVDKRTNELRGKINLQQAEDLGKDTINPKTIEDIFSGIGFEL